ncbi:HNH endonuclease [Aquibacillus saliphilus]|uniref:HNH endonuclease n=1 Tax=Aquibacillus saliphilus TaxID=1909422 RepID=UPI001CEFB3AB|nr:HNH endonuclease [Aquibacillus saliphilus]
MTKKLSYEFVEKFFSDNGCELIDKAYIDARTPMKYRCSCGNKSKIRFDDFRRGKRCRQCGSAKVGKSNQTPYEEAERIFEEQGYKIERVENRNRRLIYFYTCPKGHKDYMYLTSFKKGHRCRQCAIEERGNKYRLDISVVSKIYEDEGCTLIGDYINYETPVEYLCSCGNIAFGYIKAMKQGIKCGCGYKSGSESPNWNPNISQEEREEKRGYPEYHEWVQNVYERDDYICQCCGERGGKLHAHHIYNYSQHKDLRTDLNNGITLCDACHKDFHYFYGYQDNDEFQIKEFIDDFHEDILQLNNT